MLGWFTGKNIVYRKLSDAQVKTLMTIVAYSPDAPSDLHRYPTLRMMLDADIIHRVAGRLEFNSHSEENAYQYVVPVSFVDDCLGLGGFDDMAKAGRLMFRATAEHEVPETDQAYRERLVATLPEGAVNSAAEIGDASGKELDAIGVYLKCPRIPGDTFYYWDVLQLVAQLNKFGCDCDIPGGRIVLADGTSEENAKLIEELINTFQAKYPRACQDDEADTAACHHN